MLAIVGGVGAACAFALATLCSSRSSRMIGAGSALAWVMLVGLVAIVPGLAIEGSPGDLSGTTIAWLSAGGVANVVALLLGYSALRVGKVSLVAPILSTEGAIAALIALMAGEHLEGGSIVALGVIAVGVGLAAVATEESQDTSVGHSPVGTFYALAAAVAFGITLYAIGRVSDELPLAWVLLPARLTGVIFLAAPLAARSSLRLTRQAAPLVVISGVAEVAGFAFFAWGARHGIAVAAVLASQFAAFAAVAAFMLFGERLAAVQFAGVATILAGVAILSGLQA